MFKRMIIGITLLAFVNLMLAGCTRMVKLQLDEARQTDNTKIGELVTKQGREWIFDRKGGQVDYASETVTGTSRWGTPVEVAFADVEYLKVKEPDPVKNVLLFVGLVGLTVGIVALVQLKRAFEEPWF